MHVQKAFGVKILLVLFCLAFVSASLFAEDKGYMKYQGYKNPVKQVVAAADFEGRGLEQGEGSTLSDAFRSYLINTNAFRVMERGKMDEVLKEQGFQSSGACSDEACIVEMGQLLGVDNILAGSIGRVGGTYSVNVRFISVKTGEITRTVTKLFKGEIDGLLSDVLPDIANELAGISQPEPVVAATPAQASETKNIPPKKGKSHSMLYIGLGVLGAGGAAAAFILSQQDDAAPEEKPAGTVKITWD